MISVWMFAALGILCAMLLAVWRVVKGPLDIDRVIALDILLAGSVMLGIVAALESGRTEYIDVAIGLALVGFIGTVGWAGVLERSARRERREREEDS